MLGRLIVFAPHSPSGLDMDQRHLSVMARLLQLARRVSVADKAEAACNGFSCRRGMSLQTAAPMHSRLFPHMSTGASCVGEA